MAAYTLEKSLQDYRRLCRIRDREHPIEVQVSREKNRIGGLVLIREALENVPYRLELLQCIQLLGEVDVHRLVEETNHSSSSVHETLRQLWSMQTVWDDDPQRIFLERRRVRIPSGGAKDLYRLSALGRCIMAGED